MILLCNKQRQELVYVSCAPLYMINKLDFKNIFMYRGAPNIRSPKNNLGKCTCQCHKTQGNRNAQAFDKQTKRYCFLTFHVGEYISLELFYFVNLTGSGSLIPFDLPDLHCSSFPTTFQDPFHSKFYMNPTKDQVLWDHFSRPFPDQILHESNQGPSPLRPLLKTHSTPNSTWT